MRLYYDMLIPYMPDATKDENGELVHNDQMSAGRSAMLELSKFQNSGDVMCLYQSVIYACIYGGSDLVDTITTIPEDVDIPDGSTITSLLDESAKILFRSIKPDTAFDLITFVANVLNVAHALVSTPADPPAQPDTTEEESGHQMSIEELL